MCKQKKCINARKVVKNHFMEKSRLARAIDNFVLAIAIFTLVFLFFKQFIKSNLVCLSLTFVLSCFFVYLIRAHQNKRFSKLSIKKSELKDIENCNFELRKLPQKKQLEFFKTLLHSFCPTEQGGGLLLNNGVFICMDFNEEELSQSTVYKTYAMADGENKLSEIVILCNGASEPARQLVKKLDKKISIFTPIETYALMKKYNHFPTQSDASAKSPHRTFPLFHVFMKSRARDLIRIGLALNFVAIFIPFSKYYIIVGSISLLLGVICLLFGRRQPKDAPNRLLE